MKTKKCPKCEQTKDESEYSRRNTGFLKSYCKPCENSYNREKSKRHYHRHPELKERRARDNRRVVLRMKYGITPERYDEMLKSQGGGCAICRTTTPGCGRKHFAVDHDHATGDVRGLLCQGCNRGIGFLGDCANRLLAAHNYLVPDGSKKRPE